MSGELARREQKRSPLRRAEVAEFMIIDEVDDRDAQGDSLRDCHRCTIEYAEVAELADAQASGACGSNIVWVQVPSSAGVSEVANPLVDIIHGWYFISFVL